MNSITNNNTSAYMMTKTSQEAINEAYELQRFTDSSVIPLPGSMNLKRQRPNLNRFAATIHQSAANLEVQQLGFEQIKQPYTAQYTTSSLSQTPIAQQQQCSAGYVNTIVQQPPFEQQQQQDLAGCVDTVLPQSPNWQAHQQYPAQYITFSQPPHQNPQGQLPYAGQYVDNVPVADADTATAAPRKHTGGRPKGSKDKKPRAPKGQGTRRSIKGRNPGRPKGSKNKPKTTI